MQSVPNYAVEVAPQLDTRACASVLGVRVDAVEMDSAVRRIEAHLASDAKGFVCAVGVHGILESLRENDLADAYANSILNVPDGTPTVWLGRLRGFRAMDHVTGPDLMVELFQRAAFRSCSHFFYGGKPGIAEELAAAMRSRFPWAKIAGWYTPPFRELTRAEEEELIARIEELKPDIVWVGISTPRQEMWMRRMLPVLRTRLMLGVGAAFDFHTGRIRHCPRWIKRAGFNWLHRLLQDPRRLWRRNVHNMAFFWHIGLQLSGIRTYPAREINKGVPPDDRRADRTCSGAQETPLAHSLRQS